MFKFIKKLFEPEQVDWSDVEQLESRIRDIRVRIYREKSAQKPVLPAQRVYSSSTLQVIKNKSNDIRRSLDERSAIPQQSEQRPQTQAEKMKAKLLGKKAK